jgi:hypothetical protein
MIKLISTIYETEKRPKDFKEVKWLP